MKKRFVTLLSSMMLIATVDAAGLQLESRTMRLHFADASRGFACTGIDNLLVGNTKFGENPSDGPGLWKLEFRTPFQAGRKSDVAYLSAREERNGKAQKISGGWRFSWSGLNLPDEKGVIDVSVEVMINAKQQSEWRMKVANRSRRFGLYQSFFPCLSSVFALGKGDALLPGPNWGAHLVKNCPPILYNVSYPSGRAPVQFMAFFQGSSGLYYAAHDPSASLKSLIVDKSNDVCIGLPAENAAQPGIGRTADFPVVIATCKGDWWEAARIYREWAMTTPWTRKGSIAERPDYPKAWLKAGYWIMAWGPGDNIRRIVGDARKLNPLPLGIHWYGWAQHPHDNLYPDYPPKAGFGKTVRELTASGNVIMPYVNGMCWDLNEPSYPSSVPSACKKENGEVYVEVWSARCGKLVTMCPTTEFWQKKVFRFCREIIDQENINALYLDQITAGPPKLCFDRTHGHPLGGGHFWVDGYRKLLSPLKAYAASREIPFCSECTAEPYMDNIDIFLTWNGRTGEDVPLLPAIYSGYTCYLGSPTSEKDTTEAFRVSQGRDFLWGCILGWNGDWILKASQREKFLLLARLSQLRLKNGDFQIYGQLLDDIRPENILPTITTVQNNPSPHPMTVPVVQGTLWRNRKGELGLFMVNHDSRPQSFAYSLDLKRWLGKDMPNSLVMYRGTTAEEIPLANIPKGILHRTESLSAQEICVLTIRPANGNMKAAAENAVRRAVSSEAVRAAQEFLFQENSQIRLVPEVVNDRAVRGETVSCVVGISNPGPAVKAVITWPDGQVQTLALAGNSVRPQRFSHPFPMPALSGAAKTAVRELALALPGKPGRLVQPLGLEELPTLSVAFGTIPELWAGNTFILPLRITNNSAVARQDNVSLSVPSDWQIPGGKVLKTSLISPRATVVIPVKCNISATTDSQQAAISAAIGKTAVTVTVPLHHRLPTLTAGKVDAPFAIDGRFSDWVKHAGSSSWGISLPDYRGRKSCRVQVRCAWDDDHFYLAAEVTDLELKQSGEKDRMANRLVLAFRDERIPAVNGKFGQNEFVLTENPAGSPVIYAGSPAKPGNELKKARVVIVRQGNRTEYEAVIPWEELKINTPLPGSNYGFSWAIVGDDNGKNGGKLEWTPGICGKKDSSRFGKLIFSN